MTQHLPCEATQLGRINKRQRETRLNTQRNKPAKNQATVKKQNKTVLHKMSRTGKTI